MTPINGRKYHGFHWGFLFHPEIKVELWAPYLMSLVTLGPFFVAFLFAGGSPQQLLYLNRWHFFAAALWKHTLSRFGLALEFLMDDFKEVPWVFAVSQHLSIKKNSQPQFWRETWGANGRGFNERCERGYLKERFFGAIPRFWSAHLRWGLWSVHPTPVDLGWKNDPVT